MIFMDLGINSISLSVFAHNIKAKSLYEKLGFKIYEVIDNPQKKIPDEKNAESTISAPCNIQQRGRQLKALPPSLYENKISAV